VVSLPLAVSSLASLFLSAIILFLLEWRMAAGAIAGLTVCVMSSRLLSPVAQRAAAELKEEQSDLISGVQETIHLQPVIKIFSLQRLMLQRFQAEIAAIGRTSQRTSFLAFLLERVPHLGILFFQSVGAAVRDVARAQRPDPDWFSRRISRARHHALEFALGRHPHHPAFRAGGLPACAESTRYSTNGRRSLIYLAHVRCPAVSNPLSCDVSALRTAEGLAACAT